MSRLEAQNITAGYTHRSVLKDITLALNVGEFVGLIGPNGSGKSTLLRVLSGILRPQKGSVSLEGRPLYEMKPKEIALQMAFVPQEERASFAFTVLDVVLMGRYPHIKEMKGATSKDYEAVAGALEATDIVALKSRAITELSGGEHRRVLLARALAQQTPLLLLDEPTAHLDITHQVELMQLARRLAHRPTSETGVLAALHDINQAAEFCDRLVLMNAGEILIDGPPEMVLQPEYLRQAYGAETQIGTNPISGRPMLLALHPIYSTKS